MELRGVVDLRRSTNLHPAKDRHPQAPERGHQSERFDVKIPIVGGCGIVQRTDVPFDRATASGLEIYPPDTSGGCYAIPLMGIAVEWSVRLGSRSKFRQQLRVDQQ